MNRITHKRPLEIYKEEEDNWQVRKGRHGRKEPDIDFITVVWHNTNRTPVIASYKKETGSAYTEQLNLRAKVLVVTVNEVDYIAIHVENHTVLVTYSQQKEEDFHS